MIIVEHPLRHPLQALVSLGQIYGDILYYATSMFDHYHKGVTYCRPEAYYFWGYYFFMNFIWIVIPGCECYLSSPQPNQGCRRATKANVILLDLLYSSIEASGRAFQALARQSKSVERDGHAKKLN